MSSNYLLGPTEFFDRFAGRHFGKVRAVVKSNKDPKELGRVRVYCPTVYGNDLSPWAMPCFPSGGHPENGDVNVPPIDAGVWMEFEEGKAAYPIYTGFFFSPNPLGRPSDGSPVAEAPVTQQDPNPVARRARGHKDSSDVGGTLRGTSGVPESNYAAEYPNNKVRKTPGGHIIEFDDTPGAERIQISHAKGGYIEIQPDGSIHVVSPGNKIEYSVGKSEIVDGPSTRKVSADDLSEIKGNHTHTVEGKSERSVGSSLTWGVSGDEAHTVDGDLRYEVAGSTSFESLNNFEVVSGKAMNVGVQDNLLLTVAGSGSLIFSNAMNVKGASTLTAELGVLNGRLEMFASDMTGSVSKMGIDVQPLSSLAQSPIALVGDDGPFVNIGNLSADAFEPSVMGDQLSGFLNDLVSFLDIWLSDYLAHGHPWFSPSYTSAAMAGVLTPQIKMLQAQYLAPTSPKARPAILSDTVHVSKG